MILRRISESIRRQDWFTVLLEIVIVVIGVFIGIEVANWNDARKDAIEQAAILDRLADDFSALEPTVRELVEFNRTTYQGTADVIVALRRENPPADDAAFRFALARANWVQSLPQVAPTYEQLVNSGALSDIEDTALRNALTQYGDAHERLERLYPAATTIIFDPHSTYLKAVQWNMDTSSWDNESAILSYDWELLRGARGEMQAWIAFQYDLALYSETELQMVHQILARLEELRT